MSTGAGLLALLHGPRTVGVAKGRERLAVLAEFLLPVGLHDGFENGIPALRVARDGEYVAMIGRHDHQGLVQIHLLEGGLDGIVEGDEILEGPIGVAVVVGVIDAPALDHEEEPVGVLAQDVDALRGDFCKRRLTAVVLQAICLVAHVRALEEA